MKENTHKRLAGKAFRIEEHTMRPCAKCDTVTLQYRIVGHGWVCQRVVAGLRRKGSKVEY